jgi:hypothetical protein
MWMPLTSGSLFWEGATSEGAGEADEAGQQQPARQQQLLEQRSLVVLRRWSNSVYFTTNQVRAILSKYKFVPTSAEAFVIVYRRTIDWHGLASILFQLPPAVVELLRRRLGAANLVCSSVNSIVILLIRQVRQMAAQALH